MRETEELVAIVRDAAGEDADVMVDLHGRTTPAMAIQVGRALAPYRPWFLEEPCQPGNLDAMVEVARAIPIPIATGERLVTRNEFREHLEKRACAVIHRGITAPAPRVRSRRRAPGLVGMMGPLDGRVAFVTGGAHGIGRACVERLQRAGAAVVFCDIEADVGREVAETLAGGSTPVEFAPCDVTSEEQVAETVRSAIERFGSLDVVVANAGIDAPFDAATMTEPEWEDFLAIDLKSVWLSAKHALPQMRSQRRGSIVNIASIHAFVTSTGKFPYAAAKSGVIGLTRSIALDEAQYGIRVNAVCPGYTRTRMLMSGIESAEDPATAERDMLAIHPLGRIAEPIEIANVVAFLASDEASFITGAAIPVDGGLSARFV